MTITINWDFEPTLQPNSRLRDSVPRSERPHYVYLISNDTNDKVYVGLTWQPHHRATTHHQSSVNPGYVTHNTRISQALRDPKNGRWTLTVISVHPNMAEGSEAEARLIALLKEVGDLEVLNHTSGGLAGFSFDEPTRARVAAGCVKASAVSVANRAARKALLAQEHA